VLLQFLIEAVTLAAMGGIVGIVIATGASIVLAQVMEVPFLFDPGINLLSFIFSAAIGVVFGTSPRAGPRNWIRSKRCVTSDARKASAARSGR
jgi:ABC-type antimicrobial peptide transport system permease subunit